MHGPGPSTTRSVTPFLAYVVAFFAAWSIVWVWIVYPWAVHRLGDTTLSYALINIAFRFSIWVLPVFWYLRFLDRVNPFDYLKLRLHWKRGLAAGIALSIAIFALAVWRSGAPHWHTAYLTWNSVLSTSILIGFLEEVPFRGFILQKLAERCAFWIAATVSSVLFVAIHVPGWLLLHTLNLSSAASLFVFAMLMAFLFRFSKSLWAPIAAHTLNDFISAVLFHR